MYICLSTCPCARRWICILFFPPICVCLREGDRYVLFHSGDWMVTSSAYGMIAVIMTFQKTQIGSIKMSWLSAEQGSRPFLWADACDKIMIRLLSGLHIDVLNTAYHSHHLVRVLRGWWSDADDRSANRSIRAMRPAGRQSDGVVDREHSEYKVHLFNYSGM